MVDRSCSRRCATCSLVSTISAPHPSFGSRQEITFEICFCVSADVPTVANEKATTQTSCVGGMQGRQGLISNRSCFDYMICDSFVSRGLPPGRLPRIATPFDAVRCAWYMATTQVYVVEGKRVFLSRVEQNGATKPRVSCLHWFRDLMAIFKVEAHRRGPLSTYAISVSPMFCLLERPHSQTRRLWFGSGHGALAPFGASGNLTRASTAAEAWSAD